MIFQMTKSSHRVLKRISFHLVMTEISWGNLYGIIFISIAQPDFVNETIKSATIMNEADRDETQADLFLQQAVGHSSGR